MRVTRVFGALLLGFALALPSTAALDAQGRGKGPKADKPAKHQADKPDKAKPDKDKADHKGAKKPDRDVDVVVVDRDAHARVIREHRGTGALPPGLAKRRALPPGLRQQLIENHALPPGLRPYFVEVPAPWVARLPPVPPHYHRYFVGDDLIVVDTRTNQIVAVVHDVLR